MSIHKDLMPLAVKLRDTIVEVQKLRQREMPEQWVEFFALAYHQLDALLDVVGHATPSAAEMKIEGHEYLRWPEPGTEG